MDKYVHILVSETYRSVTIGLMRDHLLPELRRYRELYGTTHVFPTQLCDYVAEFEAHNDTRIERLDDGTVRCHDVGYMRRVLKDRGAVFLTTFSQFIDKIDEHNEKLKDPTKLLY